jgi:hypothetical protein
VLVASAWNGLATDRSAVLRLTAGAVALAADVTVVSLDDRSRPDAGPREYPDGAFTVRSVHAAHNGLRLGAVLRTALVREPEGLAAWPEIASERLLGTWARPSTEALDALEALAELAPDVIVLGGPETLWMRDSLPVGPGRPRVVVLPLLGNDPAAGSAALEPFAELADAIGAVTETEERLLACGPGRRRPRGGGGGGGGGGAAQPGGPAGPGAPGGPAPQLVQRLRVALPVNRAAAHGGLAGLTPFGRYVVVLSQWPASAGETEGGETGEAPPHDLIREIVGDVAIAEVRGDEWFVTNGDFRHEIPWARTRMNLWRLIARAAMTVDLRLPGPLGREAIESMMLGTPVVVPEGSAAAEHAEAGNGGLWFAAPGEMLEQVRYLLDHEEERAALGAAGAMWAEEEHGQTERFVREATRFVLGGTA